MIRDVLEEVAAGQLSVDGAYRVYDDVMDSSAAELPMLLGISNVEWTAKCHGVGFEELAQWRKHGWPTTCRACGRHIDPNLFGWLAQADDDGPHFLVHIACLGPGEPDEVEEPLSSEILEVLVMETSRAP